MTSSIPWLLAFRWRVKVAKKAFLSVEKTRGLWKRCLSRRRETHVVLRSLRTPLRCSHSNKILSVGYVNIQILHVAATQIREICS